MNKKAGFMAVFLLLIAIAVIAITLFAAYAWYGAFGSDLGRKMTEKSADFKENHALLSLLNTPVDKTTTIADLLATGKPASQKISETLKQIYGEKVKYIFYMDKQVIVESKETPMYPVIQEARMSLPNHKHAVIRLELRT